MVKCRDCEYAKIFHKRTKDEFELTQCLHAWMFGSKEVFIADEIPSPLNPDEERECPYYSAQREEGFFSRRQYSNLSNAGMIACIVLGVILLVLGICLSFMGIETTNGGHTLKNWMGVAGPVMAFIGFFLVLAPFIGT